MKYANDEEDYVVKELSVAKDKKIARLPIFLDDVELDGFYSMHYSGKHSILRHQFADNEDAFIEECITTFKLDFEIEPNRTYCEDTDDADEPKPEKTKQDELLEAVNSLEDFEDPPDDIVDKITNRIYEIYENYARKYLADAYGMEIEETYNQERLYMKYGPQANSFEDRMYNLKLDIPDFRNEAINRIKGLNSIGYDIKHTSYDETAITSFNPDEKVNLARYNHYVWCRKMLDEGKEYGYEGMNARYMTGVVMGSIRGDTDLIPPYRDSLVLWDELSNYEQNGNKDFVNRIFQYLPSNLKIVKRKIIESEEYLKGLISGGEKSIILEHDIIFQDKNSGDIKIMDNDLVIDGNGHTIDADKKNRIFTIFAKNVTIKNLTFKNGYTDHNGGAVFVRRGGNCSFYNCKFTGNVSKDALLGANCEGGAIYNEGFCRLQACKFHKNEIGKGNPNSKNIAPFTSFRLIDCVFDGNPINPVKKERFFETRYSFRDPDSEIYKIAERLYSKSNPSDEFSKISDEEYFQYEADAIRAACVAMACEATISSDACDHPIDLEEVKSLMNLDNGQKLFMSKMKNLGWSDGKYDYDNKLYPLRELGGSITGDHEEEHVKRIVDNVSSVGLSFCKNDSNIKKEETPQSEPCLTPKSDEPMPTKDNHSFHDKTGLAMAINMPFKAYEGNEPYIYINYVHSDWKLVYPVIKKLHDAGFNIWYDGGLYNGRNYDLQIANHIKNSALFVPFITENMMASATDVDAYCVKELSLATSQKIPILPIFLEDVPLAGPHLLHLTGKHSIFKFKYKNDEEFIEECSKAFKYDFGLETYKDDQNALPDSDYNSVFFIPCSLKDKKIAMDTYSFLASNDKRCWISFLDICAGDNPAEEIRYGMDKSDCCVLIYSKNTPELDSVKTNLELAFEKSKPVITFNVDGSEIRDDFLPYLTRGPILNSANDPKDSFTALLAILNNEKPPSSESEKKGLITRLFGR